MTKPSKIFKNKGILELPPKEADELRKLNAQRKGHERNSENPALSEDANKRRSKLQVAQDHLTGTSLRTKLKNRANRKSLGKHSTYERTNFLNSDEAWRKEQVNNKTQKARVTVPKLSL